MYEVEGVRAVGNGFFADAVMPQLVDAHGQAIAMVAVFLVISRCGLVLLGHRRRR
ncbi:hypothetical protein [Streptomyces sp. NPDC056796]|uniref:hypothetical protein n=1 Tax=Streptomyces sp. NPDC056796 TaxID=3345947 RepID=UPI0036B6C8A4